CTAYLSNEYLLSSVVLAIAPRENTPNTLRTPHSNSAPLLTRQDLFPCFAPGALGQTMGNKTGHLSAS
ncbi:hypothetical protein RB213_007441, partial [Colletotrichum asianum]